VETVAVYKEERVKVYTITEKTDLALGLLCFPAQQIEQWGQHIADFKAHTKRFELVTFHAGDKNRTGLHFLFEQNDSNILSKKISDLIIDDHNTEFTLKQPVNILYLFGPHFQDRYGIVDIAFNALLKNGIDILVSGCAGTSMYFVTPKNQSGDGLKILTDTFLIPTTF
jgi:aspartokinase